ncbi:hypothetical protein V2G26_008195 [Clonostachys chloroleuca]
MSHSAATNLGNPGYIPTGFDFGVRALSPKADGCSSRRGICILLAYELLFLILILRQLSVNASVHLHSHLGPPAPCLQLAALVPF